MATRARQDGRSRRPIGSRRHGASARARREALLRATVEVAAEVGTAGITHRAVTERAGLPLATVSYFFASIDELAEEAVRQFTDADTTEQLQLAGELAEQRRTPDEVAAAFAAVAGPRWPDTIAMVEAYLHAARRAQFRPAVEAALDASRQVATAGARAAGHPAPDTIAAGLVALAHGVALHQLAAPDRVDPDALRGSFRALFLGSLLDQGHTELALRLAGGPR